MSDQDSNISQGSSFKNACLTNTSNANEDFTIRVLTLNCWGLWLGAKKRHQRIAGIVRYLRENNCDIVFLQEIWVSMDFEIIRNGTKDMYQFAHLFRSGSVLGSSGIVILCRWMPKVIHFEPYSLNGSPFYPWHGDWFAGKGIAYSRVDFDGLSLHLFSTHTHACYKEDESVQDQYSVHRVCQSYQLARFITFISDTACNRKVNGKDLFIVAGDMNSTSSELPYKILTTMAGLTDCFKRSRFSNRSNIVHRHMTKSQKYFKTSETSSCCSNNTRDCDKEESLCKGKSGDSSILDTLDEYRNKIAHVFFDSDTDDEYTTYCHPRNSFTPGFVDIDKTSKPAQNTDIPLSSSSQKHPKVTITSDDKDFSRDTDSTGQNSAKYLWDNSRSKRKSSMKRIDFILCKLLTHGHCLVDRIVSESKDPTLECSLSDHEPVMVELKISDVSHDLMEKNHIVSDNSTNKSQSIDHSRPLAEVVESKASVKDASQLEETTNQWVQEETPVNLSCHDCNMQVMRSTQNILMQYYQYNRKSKTQLFYVAFIMFIVTLPISTYYAIANELIPISTIVLMWLAASFLFTILLLIGFLSYRFEQGAIEAIVNDITCKITVAENTLN